MNILGLDYGHNATVCLIQDGRITFCQSEERFNRIKNSVGFPERTLDYVYQNVLPPDSIDRAVLFQKSIYGYLDLKANSFRSRPPATHMAFADGKPLRLRILGSALHKRIGDLRRAINERRENLRAEATAYFSRAIRIPADKIVFLDHHLCHAFSPLPNIVVWREALIFTLDGEGDEKCATVSRFGDGRLAVLSEVDRQHSLGYYYAYTTMILGMKALEHEFKVMGLAPYAKRQYFEEILVRLKILLRINKHGRWESRPALSDLASELERLFRYQRFDNISGAIQQLTEDLIIEWVRYWVKKTDCHDIAVAGGVFMNVKACQKLAELPEVNRIIVMPSSGDESCALGAAAWGAAEFDGGHPLKPFEHLYLGRSYSDEEVTATLEKTRAFERYAITRPENINRAVGELLAENKVVARCSGRMEFGARALGNRSILADARHGGNVKVINEAIKCRDFWMPFAPAILAEDFSRYVRNPKSISADFMCITFDSTPEAQVDLCAAVHPMDKTLRPQRVRPQFNPEFHEIISTFKARTGVGGCLNTSFNLHGEPVVCSPEDAISTVDRSGLEYLAIGPFLLTKTRSS